MRAVHALVMAVVVCVTACGGPQAEQSRGGGFRILLDEGAAGHRSLTKAWQALVDGNFSVYAAPSSLSDINCFGANITGPGIPPDADLSVCVSPSNFNGVGIGITSEMGQRGAPLTATVPAGTGRTVDVYGFYPSPPPCGGTAGSTDVYFLGRKVVDIADDTTVTVSASLPAASTATCDMGGGQSAMTVIASNAYRDNASPSGTCTATVPISSANLTSFASSLVGTSTLDGTGGSEECVWGSGNNYQIVDYFFGAVGIGSPSSITVTWVGRAGALPAAYAFGTALSIPGGAVYIYTGSSTWQQIGVATVGTAASTYESVSQTLTFNPSTMVLAGTTVIVRVVGALVTGAGMHSAVDTDYVAVTYQ